MGLVIIILFAYLIIDYDTWSVTARRSTLEPKGDRFVSLQITLLLIILHRHFLHKIVATHSLVGHPTHGVIVPRPGAGR